MAKKILKEIKASDAYNRFYSDIDQWAYNFMTFGQKNLLGICKFILDYYKSKNGLSDEEMNMIQRIGEMYPALDNVSQMELNDAAKNKSFGSIQHLFDEVSSLYKVNERDESLKYGKNGIIILADNDEMLLTCAPSYKAEVSNYGWTDWCTASDIFGRWDGYIFFVRYTYYDDDEYYAGECGNDSYNDANIYIDKSLKESRCSILIQYTNKSTSKTYQMQYTVNGDFGTVCDSDDNEIYNIQSIFNNDEQYKKVLTIIEENHSTLINETLKGAKVEFRRQHELYKKYIDKARETIIGIRKDAKNISAEFIKDIIQKCLDGFSDIYDKWFGNLLLNDYGTINREYNWKCFSFMVGCNNNKMNDFIRFREGVDEVYLDVILNENDEIIFYTVRREGFIYRPNFVIIDDKPYIVYYRDIDEESEFGLRAFVNSNGEWSPTYFTNIAENYMVISKSPMKYRYETYSIESDDGEMILCIYASPTYHTNCYRTAGKVRKIIADWASTKAIKMDGSEITIDSRSKMGGVDFFNGKMDLSKDDIFSIVNECVKRVLNNKNLL